MDGNKPLKTLPADYDPSSEKKPLKTLSADYDPQKDKPKVQDGESEGTIVNNTFIPLKSTTKEDIEVAYNQPPANLKAMTPEERDLVNDLSSSPYYIKNQEQYLQVSKLPWSPYIQKAMNDYEKKFKDDQALSQAVDIGKNLLFGNLDVKTPKDKEIDKLKNRQMYGELHPESQYDIIDANEQSGKSPNELVYDKQQESLMNPLGVKRLSIPKKEDYLLATKTLGVLPSNKTNDLSDVMAMYYANHDDNKKIHDNLYFDPKSNAPRESHEKVLMQGISEVSAHESFVGKSLKSIGADNDFYDVYTGFKGYEIAQKDALNTTLSKKVELGEMTEEDREKQLNELESGLEESYLKTLPGNKVNNFLAYREHLERMDKNANAFKQYVELYPTVKEKMDITEKKNKQEKEQPLTSNISDFGGAAIYNKALDIIDNINELRYIPGKIGRGLGRAISGNTELVPEDIEAEKFSDLTDQYFKITMPDNPTIDPNTNKYDWKTAPRSFLPQIADMASIIFAAGKFTKVAELAGMAKTGAELTGMTASAFALSYGDNLKEARRAGMSEDQATAYAVPTTGITSLMYNISSKDFMPLFASQSFKEGSIKAFVNAVTGESKTKALARYIYKYAQSSAVEMPAQMLAIGYAGSVMNHVANYAMSDIKNPILSFNPEYPEGSRLDDNFDSKKIKETYVNALCMGLVFNGGSLLKSGLPKTTSEAVYELLDKYNDNDLSNNAEFVGKQYKHTPEMINSKIEELKVAREVYNNIPKDLSDRTKKTLFDLSLKKKALENSLDEKSKLLEGTTKLISTTGETKETPQTKEYLKPIREAIKNIDKKISSIVKSDEQTKPVQEDKMQLPSPEPEKPMGEPNKSEPQTVTSEKGYEPDESKTLNDVFKEKKWNDKTDPQEIKDHIKELKSDFSNLEELDQEKISGNVVDNQEHLEERSDIENKIEVLQKYLKQSEIKQDLTARGADGDPSVISSVPGGTKLNRDPLLKLFKEWDIDDKNTEINHDLKNFEEQKDELKKQYEGYVPDTENIRDTIKKMSLQYKKDYNKIVTEEHKTLKGKIEKELGSLDGKLEHKIKIISKAYDDSINLKKLQLINTEKEIEGLDVDKQFLTPYKKQQQLLKDDITSLEKEKEIQLSSTTKTMEDQKEFLTDHLTRLESEMERIKGEKIRKEKSEVTKKKIVETEEKVKGKPEGEKLIEKKKKLVQEKENIEEKLSTIKKKSKPVKELEELSPKEIEKKIRSLKKDISKATSKKEISKLNTILSLHENKLEELKAEDELEKKEYDLMNTEEELGEVTSEKPQWIGTDRTKNLSKRIEKLQKEKELLTTKPEITFKDVTDKKGVQIYDNESEALSDYEQNAIKENNETFEEFLKRTFCKGISQTKFSIKL
jgi:hypothetical protein